MSRCEACSSTLTRRPISRAGTEYRLVRTVTWANRSTRRVSPRPVSNSSSGSGLSSGLSMAKNSPTVRVGCRSGASSPASH
jgi:hypothetical protein